MTVTNDPVVGPPKAKVGCPEKNLMIVDGKSFGQNSIIAFLSKHL